MYLTLYASRTSGFAMNANTRKNMPRQFYVESLLFCSEFYIEMPPPLIFLDHILHPLLWKWYELDRHILKIILIPNSFNWRDRIQILRYPDRDVTYSSPEHHAQAIAAVHVQVELWSLITLFLVPILKWEFQQREDILWPIYCNFNKSAAMQITF